MQKYKLKMKNNTGNNIKAKNKKKKKTLMKFFITPFNTVLSQQRDDNPTRHQLIRFKFCTALQCKRSNLAKFQLLAILSDTF